MGLLNGSILEPLRGPESTAHYAPLAEALGCSKCALLVMESKTSGPVVLSRLLERGEQCSVGREEKASVKQAGEARIR